MQRPGRLKKSRRAPQTASFWTDSWDRLVLMSWLPSCAEVKGVLVDDGIVAVRSGRDQLDGESGLLADVLQVGGGVGGQAAEAAGGPADSTNPPEIITRPSTAWYTPRLHRCCPCNNSLAGPREYPFISTSSSYGHHVKLHAAISVTKWFWSPHYIPESTSLLFVHHRSLRFSLKL